jgi:hypothetical protein
MLGSFGWSASVFSCLDPLWGARKRLEREMAQHSTSIRALKVASMLGVSVV